MDWSKISPKWSQEQRLELIKELSQHYHEISKSRTITGQHLNRVTFAIICITSQPAKFLNNELDFYKGLFED